MPVHLWHLEQETVSLSAVHRSLPSFPPHWVIWLLHPVLEKKKRGKSHTNGFAAKAVSQCNPRKTEALTQRKNGDVWWSVWAQQRVLPGFV